MPKCQFCDKWIKGRGLYNHNMKHVREGIAVRYIPESTPTMVALNLYPRWEFKHMEAHDKN